MIARRIDRRVGKIGKSDSYIYRIRELRRVYGCTLLVAKEFADEMFSEYKAKGGPPWHR
jgi:cyanate lyase